MGRSSDATDTSEKIIKSRQRVSDHGEVITPLWMVEDMLDLVRNESERIDSRFLEPACGSGNFLAELLKRKLNTVEQRYGKSDFEKKQYSIMALMCIYGIELQLDNVLECRKLLFEIFDSYLSESTNTDLRNAAKYVLIQNIVHGDALTMRTEITKGLMTTEPITFAEWGYLGKGKFQRRDFRFDVLTQMSAFHQSDTLFADMGRHEVFSPTRVYPQASISEIARMLT